MLPLINGLNYLACPYTSKDPWVREERYKGVLQFTVKMLKEGHVIFSPLVHTHYTGKMLGREVDHDFWLNQDMPILLASKRVIVLMMSGWEHSKGVEAEVKKAKEHNIEVIYITVD